MKRIALLPVAALVFAGACTDAPTASPAPPTPTLLGTEPPPEVTGRTLISPADPPLGANAASSSSHVGVCTDPVTGNPVPGCVFTSFVINKTDNTEKTNFLPQSNTPLPVFVRQALKQQGAMCMVNAVLQPCEVTTNTSEGAIFVRPATLGFATDGKGLAYSVNTCQGPATVPGVPGTINCDVGTGTATTVVLDQFDSPGPLKTWACASSANPNPQFANVGYAACFSRPGILVDNWFIVGGVVTRITTFGSMEFQGGACETGVLVPGSEGGFSVVFPTLCDQNPFANF